LIARRGPLLEINKESRPGQLLESSSVKKSAGSGESGPKDCYLSELHKELTAVLASNPASRITPILEDEAEDPKSAPMMWVSKWVDYSDKYGFGYALSDESIGVVFNDFTKLMLLTDGS
jgi:polo-like kinase 1